jgi:hypothetical protein
MRSELFIEVIVIGIFAIILDILIYRVLVGEFPSPSLPHYYKMILGAFILGASMHIILEFAGMNEYWCKRVFK